MEKNKILIIAYACEPYKGSEPGVGWGWAWQISRFAEVWVVTRANNRGPIEEFLQATPNPNLHFIYLDTPKWMRFWKKGGKGILFYYILWQIYSLFKIPKRIDLSLFSAIHHLTFVNDSMPSLFGLLKFKFKNTKFIWGPMGGNEGFPLHLWPWWVKLKEKLKSMAKRVSRVLPPFVLAKKLADFAIFINENSRKRISWKKPYAIIPAISLGEIPQVARKEGSGEIKVIFAGNFIWLKNPLLALEAFAEVLKRNPKIEAKFYMAGKGKLLNRAEKFARKLGIEANVQFLGWLPRNKLFELYSHGDIFLFPSLEGGGLVVLEAMAYGLPVVCLDYGGPGEMVDDTCGIKVKVTNYSETVDKLAEALTKLAENKDLRERLSKGARKRVKEYYTWEVKGKEIKKVYEELGIIE